MYARTSVRSKCEMRKFEMILGPKGVRRYEGTKGRFEMRNGEGKIECWEAGTAKCGSNARGYEAGGPAGGGQDGWYPLSRVGAQVSLPASGFPSVTSKESPLFR